METKQLNISKRRLLEIWDNLVGRLKKDKQLCFSRDVLLDRRDITYEAEKYLQEFLDAGFDANRLVELLDQGDIIFKYFNKLKDAGADITVDELAKKCSSDFVENHWGWFYKHGANTDKMVWKCFDADYYGTEEMLESAPGISPRTAYNFAKEKDLNLNSEIVEATFSLLVKHGLDKSAFGNWLKSQPKDSPVYEHIVSDIIHGFCDDFVPHPEKYAKRWCKIYKEIYVGNLKAIPEIVPSELFLNFVTVDEILESYRNGTAPVADYRGSNKVLTEKALREFGGYPKEPLRAELLVALLEYPSTHSLPIDADELAAKVKARNMSKEQKDYFYRVLKDKGVRASLLRKFKTKSKK